MPVVHDDDSRSFQKRRTRDDEGKALVEGHRLVCDLIEAGHKPSLVIVSHEVGHRATLEVALLAFF